MGLIFFSLFSFSLHCNVILGYYYLRDVISLYTRTLAMDEKTVKQRIKAYRKESKLSQKEIADKIGISRNAYIGIENGDTRIFNEKLQKIAELTDTTIEKLVLGYEPVENADIKLGEAKSEFNERFRTMQLDYEARIKEKDDTIALLKKLVDSLQESLRSKDSIIALLQK